MLGKPIGERFDWLALRAVPFELRSSTYYSIITEFYIGGERKAVRPIIEGPRDAVLDVVLVARDAVLNGFADNIDLKSMPRWGRVRIAVERGVSE